MTDRITIPLCTCSEHQLYHVGCDCGHEERWREAPKDVVYVWPKGYAHADGRARLHVLAGTPREEIKEKVFQQYGSFATISSIDRYDPNPVASVSEDTAAYYRKGDNS